MAITTHESADVGVCITNRLSSGKFAAFARSMGDEAPRGFVRGS
jgi:hypothetical protein